MCTKLQQTARNYSCIEICPKLFLPENKTTQERERERVRERENAQPPQLLTPFSLQLLKTIFAGCGGEAVATSLALFSVKMWGSFTSFSLPASCRFKACVWELFLRYKDVESGQAEKKSLHFQRVFLNGQFFL